MKTRSDIEETLLKSLTTYTTAQSIEVASENKEFSPVIGELYFAIQFLSNAPDNTVLAEGYEQIMGMMQVDIHAPANKGRYATNQQIDALKAIFKTNGIINNTVGTVHLGKVYEGGKVPDSVWYKVSLTIEYKEFNSNT